MQQGCCGYGFDPIGEAASRPSQACGPRLDPIGEAATALFPLQTPDSDAEKKASVLEFRFF
jgi:hypothetical protein